METVSLSRYTMGTSHTLAHLEAPSSSLTLGEERAQGSRKKFSYN